MSVVDKDGKLRIELDEDKKVVQTGDGTSPALWAMIAALSVGTISFAAIQLYGRRREEDEI